MKNFNTKIFGVTTSPSEHYPPGSERAKPDISLAWQLGNPPLSESLLGGGLTDLLDYEACFLDLLPT